MIVYFSLGYTLWFIPKGQCGEVLLGVLEQGEANYNGNRHVSGEV